MDDKVNLLFVCTYNEMRSRTGEEVYRGDSRFSVKSAGIDEYAKVRVEPGILGWAHCIAVMEDRHVRWINFNYPDIVAKKQLICMDIPDAYYFMEAELVESIRERFEEMYRE